jgi:hypothetical protein
MGLFLWSARGHLSLGLSTLFVLGRRTMGNGKHRIACSPPPLAFAASYLT